MVGKDKPAFYARNYMMLITAPDLTICRILNGMWQVAGGHGYIDHKSAIEDMITYHDAGLASDIYAQYLN
jgi:hypothetical protein